MAKAHIVIALDDAGQLSVTGEFDSKVTALGLIELAKDAIKGVEEQRRIVPATLASVGGKH
jgi:hypothetical protein